MRNKTKKSVGAQTGNKNAAKEDKDKKTIIVNFVVTKKEKDKLLKMAEGKMLSRFIRQKIGL